MFLYPKYETDANIILMESVCIDHFEIQQGTDTTTWKIMLRLVIWLRMMLLGWTKTKLLTYLLRPLCAR